MSRVAIGIHAHEEPDGPAARTVAELRRTHAAAGSSCCCCPMDRTRRPAPAIASLRRSAGRRRRRTRAGPRPRFNRLAPHSAHADVVVLLESGCRRRRRAGSTPLLAALAAIRANGLAGPSTNISWNEQGASATADGRAAEIATVAREAASRSARRGAIARAAAQPGRLLLRRPARGDRRDRRGRRRLRARAVLGDGLQRPRRARGLPRRVGVRRVRASRAVHGAAPRRGSRAASKRAGAATRTSSAARACAARSRLPAALPRRRLPNFAPAALIGFGARIAAARATPVLAALSPPVAPPPRPAGAEPLVSCIMPTRDRAELRAARPSATSCARTIRTSS